MTDLIQTSTGFALLALIVLGWTVATEYAILLVFDILDYWRRHVQNRRRHTR